MIRRLLVTGGAGFIGSNFVHHWCSNYPNDKVIVLDALTYAGNRINIQKWEEQENFRFVRGDICNASLVKELLQAEDINTIVHFAAESHVDRSILEPRTFAETNVMGTLTLLDAFRDRWISSSKSNHKSHNKSHNKPENYLFIHVSTDEVYGSLNPEDPAFTETTPLNPNSPYSASKAGSDHFVRAYHHTYNLPTIITNCSNNYGAYQFPEKLIPLMCINMLMGKPLPIYGDGKNVRDWLYVGDHCRALDVVINQGKAGETYNIGGNNEVENIQLVQTLCNLMDELADNLPVTPCADLITFVKDRPGHDRRYAINASKMKYELNWIPKVDIQSGLRLTAQWYLQNRDWWQPLLSVEYQRYYNQVYGDN